MSTTADPKDRAERKKAVNAHRKTVLSATKGEQQLATVRRRFKSKKRHFLCPLSLRNRLPDPVPGPKLLAVPMELQSFVAFRPTSLDTEYKWRHHCERTLGVHIDLVDLDAHTPAEDPTGRLQRLHPDDDRLLKWDSHAAGNASAAAAARKERHFFRKPVFMSNDLSRNSALAKTDKDLARVGVKRKTEQDRVAEAEATLEAAAQSFDAAKRTLVHSTKPHLTAVWSLPVLPDAELWANQYRYVGFDDDPSGGAKRARLPEGLIVNAKNEYNPRAQDTILTGSFILPTEEPASSEGEQSYAWQRQYAMHLEKTTETRGNFLLLVDEETGVVTYKELATQKLELRGGAAATKERAEELDRYVVQRREFTGVERRERRDHAKVLVPWRKEGSDDEEGGGEPEVDAEAEPEVEVDEPMSEEEKPKVGGASPLEDDESGLSDA